MTVNTKIDLNTKIDPNSTNLTEDEAEIVYGLVKREIASIKNAALAGAADGRDATFLTHILNAFLAGRAGALPDRLREVVDQHNRRIDMEYNEYLRLRAKFEDDKG